MATHSASLSNLRGRELEKEIEKKQGGEGGVGKESNEEEEEKAVGVVGS